MKRLLHRHQGITFLFEATDGLQRIFHINGRDHLFRAQGGFANQRRRRKRTDTAEPHGIRLETVRAAENGAHIVGAADIVQHDDHPAFCGGISLRRQASEFRIEEFSVFHRLQN